MNNKVLISLSPPFGSVKQSKSHENNILFLKIIIQMRIRLTLLEGVFVAGPISENDQYLTVSSCKVSCFYQKVNDYAIFRA